MRECFHKPDYSITRYNTPCTLVNPATSSMSAPVHDFDPSRGRLTGRSRSVETEGVEVGVAVVIVFVLGAFQAVDDDVSQRRE